MRLSLSREQKFLYTRVTILLASVAWIAFFLLGLRGFTFWHAPFLLFFWLGVGLSNYAERSSVWLLFTKRRAFLILFAALAGGAFLFDEFGLRESLWFYPRYDGWSLLLVYFLLYPLGGLASLELLYFLAKSLGERLTFVHLPETLAHKAVDVLESLFFLGVAGSALASLLQPELSSSLVLSLAFSWMLIFALKLAFHTRHGTQYLIIVAISILVSLLLQAMPDVGMFEWVYLGAPILNQLFFNLPLWVFLCYAWLLLFTLRLWISLILHPKVQ
ncbi:MAG: hypothetical protein A2849_01535 [Candidatus Taylorbacteria bacterium RIFCSPHIGHO2_01_FULL_51_15]|uniref:Lycopene cyclase domain-containing protein n=1 Tax=Candidatus Taylorbacteria bacterium RIFCSPHIGHO2_01_FULL_51_15 TaxID=1802304 RepID=A0A1G2MB75_9BACT|nr:MAG: hypothetical protein A2849_01535 [Candidatus Taylorbacteria bacterium RIFCSPHIGHO2_01_FULL_51_15]